MENDKKKVYSGKSQIQAMGFKNALTDANILYHESVKADSAYAGLFEEIQIFVDPEDEVVAMAILRTLNF